jgi:glycosyltransferase involved in cell wall biosynthesis
MTKKVSVICATLLRPEFKRLVASVQAQTLDRELYEFVPVSNDPVNEYNARNRAVAESQGEVLCFVDDDTILPPDYLEKGLAHFEADPALMVMNASVRVQGNLLVDKPFWTIGATFWCRRSAFDALGGLEVTWGLPTTWRGWRSDTDFVWKALDLWGDGCYLHAEDVVVSHPEAMKAPFLPSVEKVFYLRHRERCLEILLPVDVRMAFYIPIVDPDPVAQARAKAQVEKLVKAGYVKPEQVEPQYAEMRRLMG